MKTNACAARVRAGIGLVPDRDRTLQSRFVRIGVLLGAVIASAGLAAPGVHAIEEYVPCQIHQRERINFPIRLLNEGILRGEAMLMLDVDRTGRLVDALAFAYTHREFADAALLAAKGWGFKPALVAGEAVGSTITLTVQFEVTGVLAYVKPIGSSETNDRIADRFAYYPVPPTALDRAPMPITRTGPIYPREWIEAGKTGSVTVEFFIDENGQVRFPRVLGRADDHLGAAAVAAVRQWRFEPPLRNRKPVLTRANQLFLFQPETAPGKS